MLQLFNFPQHSKEWFDIRKGRITGTKAHKFFSSTYLELIDDLISEKTSGADEEDEQYIGKWAERGTANEPFARDLYEQETFTKIIQYGFCINDNIPLIGLSPDGFTEDLKGAIEIKCLKPSNHVNVIRKNKIPSKHIKQVLWYFVVNEQLEWLDFVSYDENSTLSKLWVIRVTRAELQHDIDMAITRLEDFAKKYLNEYEKLQSQLS